jgi:tectonic-1/3
LTSNSCDLFCCCDPSCSAANKADFAGRCREKVPSSVLPLCLSSSTFVTINANTLKDSPLCIERSNSPLLGEFHPPPPSALLAADVASGTPLCRTSALSPLLILPAAIASKRASLSNAAPAASLAGPYVPGKLLTAAATSSGTLKPVPNGGFFTFLQRGPDGTCTPAPVAFFANVPPATCYLSATAGTTCGNAAQFSTAVGNSLLTLVASKHNAPSTEPSLFRSVTRLFRSNVPLSNGTFAPPASALCTRPVSITLRIQHDGAGAIVAAFTDEVHLVASSSKEFADLQVSIEFVTYNPLTNLPPVLLKSGNPGYTPGLPVLAASLVADVVTVDTSGLRLPYSGDAHGRCLDPLLRASSGSSGLPVLFNVDAGAGCRLTMNQSLFDSVCATSGTQAFLKPPANLAVGRWGDAVAASAADWLPVAAPVAGAVPVLTASACQSMVSGLEVNIVYTASGLKSNPQFTIVAASASFISQDVIRPHDTSSSVTVSLSTTVTFTYKPPSTSETIYASPPRVLPPLPVDIFYPFIMDSAAASLSVASAAVFALAAAALLML